jgi:hypothetical protein
VCCYLSSSSPASLFRCRKLFNHGVISVQRYKTVLNCTFAREKIRIVRAKLVRNARESSDNIREHDEVQVLQDLSDLQAYPMWRVLLRHGQERNDT